MSLIDRFWGIIFNPKNTMQYLVTEKPIGQGLVLYCAVLAVIMIINQGVDTLRPIEDVLNLPVYFIWVIGTVGIIISVLLLFLGTGFISLLCGILYGRENSTGLLAGFCFASLPGLFGPLLQYVSIITGLNWLGVIFSIIAIIWVVVLQIIAVQAAFDVSVGQAILLFFLPVIILLVTIIISTLITVFMMPQLF